MSMLNNRNSSSFYLDRHMVGRRTVLFIRLIVPTVSMVFGSNLASAASSPEEIVKGIYGSFLKAGDPDTPSMQWLSAPERRSQYFSRRIATLFDADDTYGDNLSLACIDFALELNGQNFDEEEINRSLALTTTEKDGQKIVEARFTNFGEKSRFQYTFIKDADAWKIDDIASFDGGSWRLSEIGCKPASGAALHSSETIRYAQNRLLQLGFDPGEADGQFGSRTKQALRAFENSRGLSEKGVLTEESVAALSSSYAGATAKPVADNGMVTGKRCFSTSNSTLTLSMRGNGGAYFEIDSAQGNGHVCGLSGLAEQIKGGWRYREDLEGIGQCQLDLLLGSDGTISFKDVDWNCKSFYCGMRADFEFINFSKKDGKPC